MRRGRRKPFYAGKENEEELKKKNGQGSEDREPDSCVRVGGSVARTQVTESSIGSRYAGVVFKLWRRLLWKRGREDKSGSGTAPCQ